MPGAFDNTLNRMYNRTALDELGPHLEKTHGIAVERLTKLDVGVFKVDRHDGPPWVARVFPAARPSKAADGDVAALRYAEKHDLPAERLAVDKPQSELDGQQVVVTEFVVESSSKNRGQGNLIAMLLRQHSLPLPSRGAAKRPAGALHHYAEGTRADELRAAAGWLDQIQDRIAAKDATAFDKVRAAVNAAEGGEGLPLAFIHPDPAPKNIIRSADGPVLVDWTGAGIGARVLSLELLLNWASTSAASMAAYTSVNPLTDEEWERLPGLLFSRRLINMCFGLCFEPHKASAVASKLTTARRESEKRVATARSGARP